MDYEVAADGLAEEQVSRLATAMPEEYKATTADCVTDLIVLTAFAASSTAVR